MSFSTDVRERACGYTWGRKTTLVNGVASRERRHPRQAGCRKEHDHDAEPLRPRTVSSSPLPGVAARGRARAEAFAIAPVQSQRTAVACTADAVLARSPVETAKRIPAAYRLRKGAIMPIPPKSLARSLLALSWLLFFLAACSFSDPATALRPGTLLWGYQGAASVFTAAWSPNGHSLALGEADGTVQVRDALTGTLTFSLYGHTGAVWALA